MFFISMLLVSFAHATPVEAPCADLLRFSFELETYGDIAELLKHLPGDVPAEGSYVRRLLRAKVLGPAPDLRDDTRAVFDEFKDRIWNKIWVPDREVEADLWECRERIKRNGVQRASASVAKAMRRYGLKDQVEYAQRVEWTERGTLEGLPRPHLRYDFGIRGNRRLLSRADRELINQILCDPGSLPEPYARLRPLKR